MADAASSERVADGGGSDAADRAAGRSDPTRGWSTTCSSATSPTPSRSGRAGGSSSPTTSRPRSRPPRRPLGPDARRGSGTGPRHPAVAGPRGACAGDTAGRAGTGQGRGRARGGPAAGGGLPDRRQHGGQPRGADGDQRPDGRRPGCSRSTGRSSTTSWPGPPGPRSASPT